MTSQLPPGAGDLDDEAVESLLRGESWADELLATVLVGVRDAFPVVSTPEPSAELAAVLDGTATLPRDELAARRGNRVIGASAVAVAAAATLAVSGVAAAHDALPTPLRTVVTEIVNHATPFTIDPRPASAPRSPAGQESDRQPRPVRPPVLDVATPSATPGTASGSRGEAEPGRHSGGRDSGDGSPGTSRDRSSGDRSGSRDGRSGSGDDRSGSRDGRSGSGDDRSGSRDGRSRSSDDRFGGSGSGDDGSRSGDHRSGSGDDGSRSGDTRSGSGRSGGSGGGSRDGHGGTSHR